MPIAGSPEAGEPAITPETALVVLVTVPPDALAGMSSVTVKEQFVRESRLAPESVNVEEPVNCDPGPQKPVAGSAETVMPLSAVSRSSVKEIAVAAEDELVLFSVKVMSIVPPGATDVRANCLIRVISPVGKLTTSAADASPEVPEEELSVAEFT